MQAPIQLVPNLKKIASELRSPRVSFRETEFKDTAHALAALGSDEQFYCVDPHVLSSAQAAGERLENVLDEARGLTRFLADPRQEIGDGDLSDAISEIQSILDRARALKRLALIEELLGKEKKISFRMQPSVQREIGKWGMIFGHSHHLLNQAVSGQIIAESGPVEITKESSHGIPCYRLCMTSSYYENKTLRILINADPANAARGQVAEWTAPLDLGLGIFFTDPYLGGMQHPKREALDIEDFQAPLLPKPEISVKPLDWGQREREEAKDTKRVRDFAGQHAEDYADHAVRAIIERESH